MKWVLSALHRFPYFFEASNEMSNLIIHSVEKCDTSKLNSYSDAAKMFAFSKEVAQLAMWMCARYTKQVIFILFFNLFFRFLFTPQSLPKV